MKRNKATMYDKEIKKGINVRYLDPYEQLIVQDDLYTFPKKVEFPYGSGNFEKIRGSIGSRTYLNIGNRKKWKYETNFIID